MSIQSSFSKILFAFKHHLSKGLPLVLGQRSNSGEGVPHWVCVTTYEQEEDKLPVLVFGTEQVNL